VVGEQTLVVARLNFSFQSSSKFLC